MLKLTGRARALGRLTSALVIAALGVTVAGCQSGTPAPSASTSVPPTGEVLTFWHYWTDREQLMNDLAAQYKAQTGVEVKMELVPGDGLQQKFQAAAQAGNLPDISASWTTVGDTVAPYAKDGQIVNLDQTNAKDWMSARFTKTSLENVSFLAGNQWSVTPGAYYVPIDVNNMQFLYNKDLFAKAGIATPPATMDDFIADSQKLRAAGIQPFVSGFGSWGQDSMAVLYQWRSIGQDGMEQTFRGKTSYNSAPWISSLALFKTLADNKVFADGILGYDMPAAEALFAGGKVAMLYDGSWATSTFGLTNPDFKNYGVFMPPTWGDHPQYIAGGVGASAFVTGTSKHQQAAVDFLKWLTDVPQQKVYSEKSLNIPANKQVVDALPADDNTRLWAQAMDMIFPTSKYSMTGPVQTTMDKGIQDIIAGKATPEQIAAKMQDAADSGKAK